MLGTQMREGFETEGARRKEDYKSLEEKMSARIGEGFMNEIMQESWFKMNWQS